METLKILLFHRYWHRTGGMLGFAILLGLAGGVAAALFKAALDTVQYWVLERFSGFPVPGTHAHVLPDYLFFLVPAVGGLVAGILVYSFAQEAAGAGTDALIDAYHNKEGHIPLRVAVVKFFASVVTLGSGGSAGQEGPMAQIGGGLGSTVGRIFRLPDRLRRLLLLTGTAAGLGAIFHAPLGAALTAAEIVYREDFESQGILPFIVASVVALATFTLLTHQAGAYLHFPIFPFTNPLELFNYALVGAACVPLSWLFVKVFHGMQDAFSALRIRKPLKPALGGLMVGLIAYLCPEAAGTNWGYLNQAVAGGFPFLTLLFIALAKILATSFTIGSGGSGGVFGPSLFIGGMVGGAVGFGLHGLNPEWVANPGSYVLVGMGAFFAGAAKAPLAGLIMVCEITGNYGLLPPLLIATTVHLALSRPWSLYRSQRLNKFSSPVHARSLRKDALRGVPLSAILSGSGKVPKILQADWKMAKALDSVQDLNQEMYPVTDAEGRLVGMVPAQTMHHGISELLDEGERTVQEIMDEPYALEASMDLQEALSEFIASGASQLPVLDLDGRIFALVKLHEIMSQYGKAVETPEDGR